MMTEVVVDASVLIKWFHEVGEDRIAEARALHARFQRSELLIVVPALVFLELLNFAARRLRWDAPRLEELATTLGDFGFVVHQSELTRIAPWCGRGLTAYDACYLALAEERNTVVITADDRMLVVGGRLARALSAVTEDQPP